LKKCKYARNPNEAASHTSTPTTEPGVIQYQCCYLHGLPNGYGWIGQGHRLKDWTDGCIAVTDEHNLLGRASELAYNYLLAIFPLLLFLVALLGLFAERGTQLRSDLLFYLSQLLPPAAADLVEKTLNEVTSNSGSAKITFGIVLALVSASGGMSSMISALNGVYTVRESRPWWKVRLIALGLTTAIAALVIAALALVLFGDYAAELVGSKLHLGSLLVVAGKVLQWPAALFFITLSYSLIYFVAPDVEDVSSRRDSLRFRACPILLTRI
jgi:membrane protein